MRPLINPNIQMNFRAIRAHAASEGFNGSTEVFPDPYPDLGVAAIPISIRPRPDSRSNPQLRSIRRSLLMIPQLDPNCFVAAPASRRRPADSRNARQRHTKCQVSTLAIAAGRPIREPQTTLSASASERDIRPSSQDDSLTEPR